MPHGRPDSMDSFDDNYERDYENDDPSEAPPQPQVQPQRQEKAEPAAFTLKAAEQRGRGRKSLVILYVLVGASLLVSAAAIVLILLKVTTCSICPACWLPNAGNCYYFSTVRKNWSYAKQACKDQGAQLIIIENKQEQEFLTKNSNGKNYWIGLNDIDKEGTFKWIDDSSVSYRNWDQGEPNDDHNHEDCVHILKDGKWNDAPCGINRDGWICEKKWAC